jgi:hypothetical protein
VKLLLNDKPYQHPISVKTWANWLDVLDADAPRTGRIVTAVRFDGVDEPAFRATSVLERTLSAFDTIQVDTAPPRDLVAQSLRRGAILAGSLAEAAIAAGRGFRGDDRHDAHAMLPQFVEGIRSIVVIADACTTALDVQCHMLTCEGIPLDEWMHEFGRRLAALLDAEATHDWLTVADSLEYELEPSLRGWGSLLEDLAETAEMPVSPAPV